MAENELLVVTILKEAGRPLTTKEIQIETRKTTRICPSASAVGLNIQRRLGIIKGKRAEGGKGWIWWVED